MAGLAANQMDITDLFDVIVLLRCPAEVFLRRIHHRADNRYGQDAAEQEVILATYGAMEEQMLTRGAIPVDADRPLAEVAREVLALLAPDHDGAPGM